MRFLVIAPSSLISKPISDAIIDEIKNICIDAEIDIIFLLNFCFNATYFEHKISKLGLKNYEQIYNNRLTNEVLNKCKDFKPDFILILSGENIPVQIQEFLAQYKTILWMWDSYKRLDALKNFVRVANEIFCFEYDDIATLRESFNIPLHYLPLGVNDKIYYPVACERDIDISFVGIPNKHRIEILEKVSERACKNNWVVKIAGPFLEDRHIYKRFIFKLRNAHLAKFIDKAYYNPNEAADLYRRSKICLNINAKEHRSLNPRTFEICATNSFQLMNAGQHAHGLMNLDTDLATYNDVDDLLNKIEYYLANEELRKQIALSGYKSVMKNCTLRKSVEKLLSESEIIRGLTK